MLKDAERWLDIYFQGKEPDFMPALHPVGTEFQSAVWEILRRIPYGRTITYGEIAGQLAAQRDVKKCPRRQWEVQWAIIRYPLSFPAIVW